MVQVAEFKKVKKDIFLRDISNIKGFNYCGEVNKDGADSLYENIKLPVRSSANTCKYDIHTNISMLLKPGKSCVIATGLKVEIDEGWLMLIVPNEKLGLEYRVELDNTVGVYDGADSINEKTDGHIFIKITNNGQNKNAEIGKGSVICHAIFIPYGVTKSDKFVEN